MLLARVVQQRFFPAPPAVPGLDLGGASYPAGATGGDYYDFFALPDGALGIAVGDVSGHGFGPALLMASTRAYLRGLARTCCDPCQILTQLNSLLAGDTGADSFVTLLLAALDLPTRSLCYASAGHCAGYVVDGGGRLRERLPSTGTPLGISCGAEIGPGAALTLTPGDAMVLLTDGVTEATAPDGTVFGARRALDIVRIYRRDPAQRIVNNLYHAVRAFTHNEAQDDDITTVIARVS
jgi:sigma-B regulation protein RsbU (phosphoserine phosphatase)